MKNPEFLCSRYLTIFILFLASGPAFSSKSGPPAENASARTQHRAVVPASPWISFTESLTLPAFSSESSASSGLKSGVLRPLGLASGDMNSDGVNDLITAYSNGGAGLLTFHRVNADLLRPNSREALQRRLEGTWTEDPFPAAPVVLETSVRPDFLASGDFDRDGWLDVIFASREGDRLFWVRGEGEGLFSPAVERKLSGKITVLASGDVFLEDGQEDLIVGLDGAEGPRLLVYLSFNGDSSGAPLVLNLPSPPQLVTMGQLDRRVGIDLAVAADAILYLVHGRDGSGRFSAAEIDDEEVTEHVLSSSIVAMEAGDYVGDWRDDLALLDAEGTLRVFETVERELSETWAVPLGSGGARGQGPGFPGENLVERFQLVSARVSASAKESVLVVDRLSRLIHAVMPVHPTAAGRWESGADSHVATTVKSAFEPVSLLPMQLNFDYGSDLVLLGKSVSPLNVSLSLPLGNLSVNDPSAKPDPKLDDGVCDVNLSTPEKHECTFTAAVQNANRSSGETITFAIPQATMSTVNVERPVTINGNGVTLEHDSYHELVLQGGATVVSGIKMTNAIKLSGGDGNVIQNCEANSILIQDSSNNQITSNTVSMIKITNSTNGTQLGNMVIQNNTVTGSRFVGIDDGTGEGRVGSQGVKILSNRVFDNRTDVVVGGDGGLIKDNEIGTEGSSNYAGGIYVFGGSNRIEKNTIQFEKNCGICMSGFNRTAGSVSRARNNTIIDNTIESNQFGILLHDFPADSSEDLCPDTPDDCPGHNNRIELNSITDSRSAGIHNGGSSGLKILKNDILGNRLGVYLSGEKAEVLDNQVLANKGYGIAVTGSFHLVKGNTIAENGSLPNPNSELFSEKRGFGSGVEIWGATGSRVSENRIYGNVGAAPEEKGYSQGLGIDVGGDGVTPNETGEFNGAQNAPDLILLGRRTQVLLHSTPNTDFILEFFSNAACDPTGFGEGENFLGSMEVRTDANGNWQGEYGAGERTTATATMKAAPAEGSGNPGNTSEFSKCAAVPPAVVVNSTADQQLKPGEFSCDTGNLVDREETKEPECTLRAAIELANTLEAALQIQFAIPGPGPYSIEVGKLLRKPLPAALYPLAIDGTTQTGYTGSPLVELNGQLAGPDADGLVFSGGKSAAKGMVINRFSRHAVVFDSAKEGENEFVGNYVGVDTSGLLPASNGGLGVLVHDVGNTLIRDNLVSSNSQGGVAVIRGDATSVRIEGNLIGVDKDGECSTPMTGCPLGNGGAGLQSGLGLWEVGGISLEWASNVTIGGPSAEQGNTISGNKEDGIFVTNSSKVRVEGNRVGTNRLGLQQIPNLSNGINIQYGEDIKVGGLDHDPWTCNRACNLVSANGGHGIRLHYLESGDRIEILGNFVGTDVNGAIALGNAKSGVYLNAADQVYVGGVEVGGGNLISGNGEEGVFLHGTDGYGNTPFTSRNHVEGNRIGTDAGGKTGIPNEGYGIRVTPESTENFLGFIDAGNVISANKQGGIVLDAATLVVQEQHFNRIQANFIGTGADGVSKLGNGGHGIDTFRNDTLIGGDLAAAGNTVAHNSGSGVRLYAGYRSVVRKNSILGNAGEGIHCEGCDESQVLENSVYSNTGNGLLFGRKSLNNLVGDNSIHSNQGHGVMIDELADGNRLLTNSIYGNGGLGIELRGGNREAFPPQLHWAVNDGSTGGTRVEGRQPAIEALTLEFFASSDCEGKSYLGHLTFPQGNLGPFSFESPTAVPVGEFVTATATDLSGTSEFDCKPVKLDSDGDGTPDPDDPDAASASKARTPGGTVVEAPEGTELHLTPSQVVPPVGIDPVTDPSTGTASGRFGGGAAGLGSTPLEFEPGGSLTLTLYLPEGKTATTYYNFGPTPDDPQPHWYEFLFDGTTGAEFLEDRILLHFVDGQRGDHDLLENALIVFFGVPANLADLYFPFYQADSKTFVGFAVSNFSGEPAHLRFEGMNPDGTLLTFADNPSSTTLEGGTQLAQLGHEIFGAAAGTAQLGWVVLDTDNPKLGSFFLFGGSSQLDGSVAFSRQTKHFFFTRVYEGENAFRGESATTLLTIGNPNQEPVTVAMTLIGSPNGTSAMDSSDSLEITREIPARGFLTSTVAELFDTRDVASGYIQADVTEGEGAVGFELIRLPQHQTVIGLNASWDDQAGRLYSAQLASASNIYTNLKLVNTSQQERSVVISAVGNNGAPLAEDVVVHLAAGESGEWDVSELFEDPGTAGTALETSSEVPLVGSLRLAAEGPGVMGDVIFGDPVGLSYAAALPLQTQTFREAVFSQVANLKTFFTGLALWNPGTKEAAITIEVFDESGSKAGERQLQLAAGKRISELVVDLVPSTEGLTGGYIVIRSSVSLVAQQLFGDFSLTLMSAVPPTVIRP